MVLKYIVSEAFKKYKMLEYRKEAVWNVQDEKKKKLLVVIVGATFAKSVARLAEKTRAWTR